MQMNNHQYFSRSHYTDYKTQDVATVQYKLESSMHTLCIPTLLVRLLSIPGLSLLCIHTHSTHTRPQTLLSKRKVIVRRVMMKHACTREV